MSNFKTVPADVVDSAVALVIAKTSAKGRAMYWGNVYAPGKRIIMVNASWTQKEFALYEACKDAGLLPKKCLPGKNPDEK